MVTKSGVLHDQDLLLLGAPYPLTVESDKMLRKEKQVATYLHSLHSMCAFSWPGTRGIGVKNSLMSADASVFFSCSVCGSLVSLISMIDVLCCSRIAN